MPLYSRCIEESNRFHRAGAPDKTILVVGIPNVGKSSLINQLRFGGLFRWPHFIHSLVDWTSTGNSWRAFNALVGFSCLSEFFMKNISPRNGNKKPKTQAAGDLNHILEVNAGQILKSTRRAHPPPPPPPKKRILSKIALIFSFFSFQESTYARS